MMDSTPSAMYLPQMTPEMPTIADDMLNMPQTPEVDPILLSVFDDFSGSRLTSATASGALFSPSIHLATPTGALATPRTALAAYTDSNTGVSYLNLSQGEDDVGTTITDNAVSAHSSIDNLLEADLNTAAKPRTPHRTPAAPLHPSLYAHDRGTSGPLSSPPTKYMAALPYPSPNSTTRPFTPVQTRPPPPMPMPQQQPYMPYMQPAMSVASFSSGYTPMIQQPQQQAPVHTHMHQQAHTLPHQHPHSLAYHHSHVQSHPQAHPHTHSHPHSQPHPHAHPHPPATSHSHSHSHSHSQPHAHMHAPTRPARSTRPETIPGRRYKIMAPSKFCHVCVRSGELVTLAPCANVLRGICRKAICLKCFEKHGHGEEWSQAYNNQTHLRNEQAAAAARGGIPAKASLPESAWICLHCRNLCPDSAQCKIYARTNRRRHLALKKRKEDKARSESERSAGVLAHRAALSCAPGIRKPSSKAMMMSSISSSMTASMGVPSHPADYMGSMHVANSLPKTHSHVSGSAHQGPGTMF